MAYIASNNSNSNVNVTTLTIFSIFGIAYELLCFCILFCILFVYMLLKISTLMGEFDLPWVRSKMCFSLIRDRIDVM